MLMIQWEVDREVMDQILALDQARRILTTVLGLTLHCQLDQMVSQQTIKTLIKLYLATLQLSCWA
jgi:hypothetical protein